MMLSIKNLPNILTLLRIVLIPVILALMAVETSFALVIAFVLYILAALTDFFDGWLARKLDVSSAFGRFLDPIADKLLIVCLLILFCAQGLIAGLWLIAPLVILFREILISGLREFLGPYNIVIHVTPLAKWKTTVQLVACGILILAPVLGGIWPLIGLISLGLAALITALTGWDYLFKGLKAMKEQNL